MEYGYSRVSREDQNPAMQDAALKKAGCEIIFKDKVTGAHVNRPSLTRCVCSDRKAGTTDNDS
jgi:DNA invertase Pin-like site-specific DNA recombinase